VARLLEAAGRVRDNPERLKNAIEEFRSYIIFVEAELADERPNESRVLASLLTELPVLPKRGFQGFRQKTKALKAALYKSKLYHAYKKLRFVKVKLGYLLDRMNLDLSEIDLRFREHVVNDSESEALLTAANEPAGSILRNIGDEITSPGFIRLFRAAYERSGRLSLELYPNIVVRPSLKGQVGLGRFEALLAFISREDEMAQVPFRVEFNTKGGTMPSMYRELDQWKEPFLEALEAASEKLFDMIACHSLLTEAKKPRKHY
jgi:hypothetical protein